MAEFQITCLDEEDLELVARIIKRVPEVKSLEDAVKWALKKSASKFPAARAVGPSDVLAGVIQAGTVKRLKLDTHHTTLAVRHLPLDAHRTFSIADLAKGTGKFKHTVVLANETLERLVPDKSTRAKLLGHDRV